MWIKWYENKKFCVRKNEMYTPKAWISFEVHGIPHALKVPISMKSIPRNGHINMFLSCVCVCVSREIALVPWKLGPRLWWVN